MLGVLFGGCRLDRVDQVLRRGRRLGSFARTRPESLFSLRRTPKIHEGRLVDAAHRAIRRAIFLGSEFVLHVFRGVLRQRNPGKAALLRAVMHQPVLADIEVA